MLMFLIVPLSSVCQDSLVLVNRTVLEKVANQLDSFDVLKLKELEYIKYQKECKELVNAQGDVISMQDSVRWKNEKQLMILSDAEIEYNKKLKADSDYISKLEKINRGAKIRGKIYLIGGGVLTIGLTTALIITLLQ